MSRRRTPRTPIKIDIQKYLARRSLYSRMSIEEKMKHYEPEIKLGRRVLDKALLDSFECTEAYEWFDLEDEDFLMLCFVAFLEPEDVVDKFNKIHEYAKNPKLIHF